MHICIHTHHIHRHIHIHIRLHMNIHRHTHTFRHAYIPWLSGFTFQALPGSSRKGRDCLSQLVMSTQTDDLETEDVGSQCVTPALLPVGVQTSYASDSRKGLGAGEPLVDDEACDKSISIISHQFYGNFKLVPKHGVCDIPRSCLIFYQFGGWLMLIPSDSLHRHVNCWIYEYWLLALCKVWSYAPFLLAPVFSIS